ncbi:MAG: glutamate--tRNA ligase [Patescibacteria group bacterium]
MIRVRLCPSPTGLLHIGTARTALFNILFARHNNGKVVFRMEDTDKERSTREFEKDIIDGLKWLGISWDEGMEVGGPHQPYRQSERNDVYTPYIQKLLEKGSVYHCFCTTEKLDEDRQQATEEKRASIYPGTCAHLTSEEVDDRLQKGIGSTLRFRVQPKTIVFHDLIRGDVEFDTSLIGDIIIAKDVHTPLYHLAVVIDDHEMGVTHVIRGEDHISNTPKQMLLIEALGFALPTYGHLPIILSTTGKGKMSKRRDPVSITRDFRDKGYLPEAMINFMALLGWNPGTEQEIFSLDDLVSQFSFERVQKAGAIFNLEKLQWMNSQYIHALSHEELLMRTVPFLIEQGYVNGDADGSEFVLKTGETITRKTLMGYVALEQERAKILAEIPPAIAFCFAQSLDYDPALLLWKEASKEITKEMLVLGYDILKEIEDTDFNAAHLEESLKAVISQKELKNGMVLWPLRVALSGLQHSPSPFEIAHALGKDRVLQRIQHAISMLG